MGFQSILVGSPFTLINIMKYSVIFYQVLLYTNLFFINKRKYIVIFFTFLLISSLTTLEIRGGILQSFLSTFPFGIILTLFLAFFKKLNLKTLFLFIIILGIYALISYSRTSAVLALVLSIFLVYSQFFTKQKNKKSFLFKFFAIIVLIIISLYLYFWLFESIQSVSLSNSERLLLIEIAIEEFKISPVFGIGIGNYNNYAQTVLGYQLRANNMSTHNLFLELIAETGTIGLFLFASTLYKLFVLSLSNKNYRSLLLLLVLSFYFLFNVFSGLSRSYFVIFLATSIFLVIRKESFNEFYM
jgi:O-antigen ligase